MPSWEDFKRKHVIDPTTDMNCTSWGTQEWNDWLRSRVPNEFGRRRINSVILSPPDAIVRDFEHLNCPYPSKPHFYWSNKRYRIFALTFDHSLPSEQPYRVYDFGDMFFLALISPNPNVPVHYDAQNTTQVSSGKANLNFSNYTPISK